MKSRTKTSGDGNTRRSKGDGAMAISSLKHRRRTDGKRESVEGGSPTSAAASKFAIAQLTTQVQASERERARLAMELAALEADYSRLVSAQAETASQLSGAQQRVRAADARLPELQRSLEKHGWPRLEEQFLDRIKAVGAVLRVEDISWFRGVLNATWFAGWRARELAERNE